MLKKIIAITLLLSPISLLGASKQERDSGKFSFLDEFDRQPGRWTPEVTPEVRGPAAPLSMDLSAFYDDFERDKEVTIYIGYGYEAYYKDRGKQLLAMLKRLASYYGLSLGNWYLSGDQATLRFTNLERGVNYTIRVGNARNAFINAFSGNEVVMYHGHSRYGRGPAFRGFTNYFRIGDAFDTIEVDTRNSYFRDEPMLKTDQYPPRSVTLNGTRYQYQYRGPHDSTSYLARSSYTKLIPGKDVDLANTEFSPGRQLIYFYSCKNRLYWEDTLRSKFPDPGQKFIFGTIRDAFGSTKPDALMIMSIVRRVANSNDIVDDLNATKDCDDCFTTY